MILKGTCVAGYVVRYANKTEPAQRCKESRQRISLFVLYSLNLPRSEFSLQSIVACADIACRTRGF